MELITDKQYAAAAKILNCEVAVVKAVAEVESIGAGFLPDGRLRILFEPHILYRELYKIGKLNKSLKDPRYSKILYKKQGTLKYGTFKAQWDKLELASTIDPDAAYKSCSWGKFQPLGLYHKECGFAHISDMVTRFELNEGEHLIGFVKMIKFRKLDTALRNKDWNRFGYYYNGAGYKEMNYHIKLPASYKKFALPSHKQAIE